MLEFAFDGHDGAAKTPILEGVTAALHLSGLKVFTFAPFHAANAFVGSEVYPMWEDDKSTFALLAILRDLIRDAHIAAHAIHADVLLFDRHWMTILVEIDHRPAVRRDWFDFVPTFFVRAPPSKIKGCDRFSYALGWTSSDERVEYYYQRYLEIARRYPEHLLGTYDVLHKRQPLDPIITDIVGKILAKSC